MIHVLILLWCEFGFSGLWGHMYTLEMAAWEATWSVRS